MIVEIISQTLVSHLLQQTAHFFFMLNFSEIWMQIQIIETTQNKFWSAIISPSFGNKFPVEVRYNSFHSARRGMTGNRLFSCQCLWRWLEVQQAIGFHIYFIIYINNICQTKSIVGELGINLFQTIFYCIFKM